MTYSHVSLEDLDPYDVDGLAPDLLPIGPELHPEKLRPSVWVFEEGESSNRHFQREQEELYVPLEGRLELVVEGEDGDETVEIEPGDYVVVDPPAERFLRAVTDARLLVVGAPNVEDDGIVVE